jgi:hypothetical protein
MAGPGRAVQQPLRRGEAQVWFALLPGLQPHLQRLEAGPACWEEEDFGVMLGSRKFFVWSFGI